MNFQSQSLPHFSHIISYLIFITLQSEKPKALFGSYIRMDTFEYIEYNVL